MVTQKMLPTSKNKGLFFKKYLICDCARSGIKKPRPLFISAPISELPFNISAMSISTALL